ncbi:MAG TPA: Dps family protein [Phycisphaerae bacterium]|nr:Dps family protein [Phycisphaerae bacterium]
MADNAVIDGLNAALANATVFYQKLRAFHWMVKGPQFYVLHEKFEELYDQWAETIDELAERVVQLGGTPPLTLVHTLELAKLKEEPKTPGANAMVTAVIADLKAQQDGLRKIIGSAEEHNDRTTANTLDGIVDGIDKTVWMLGALNAQ